MELSATIKDEKRPQIATGVSCFATSTQSMPEEYEELVSVYSDEYGVRGVCKLADGAVQQAADGKPHVGSRKQKPRRPRRRRKTYSSSDDFYAVQKAKRQGLALVQFFGELYKLNLLTERIMQECIKKLLSILIHLERKKSKCSVA
ncbi:hypothetical protein PGTUg99_000268 [Puccinia graminis f. sp. tritici]|uniref:Uncharacterized protein n=1 Tax=Puccinia graminis f. sp. tritici TaxID=56615 RepID=A0A5B0RA31_PUCGR|nr:hypothetical protein PGTUg99_000268 [Puccinia graminis f. sp. tritici]